MAEGDFFQAGDLEALALFDHFDIGRGFGERLVRAGVQPGEAAAEGLDQQSVVGQEGLVHGGDFQLAAGGGLDRRRDVHDAVRIEIQAGHGVVGLGNGRLFLDGDAFAGGVELRHAVAFRIADPVAENGGEPARSVGNRLLQLRFEPGTVEDIVSQHHAGRIVPDELSADDEGLRKAIRRGLLRIGKPNTVIGPVSEQPAEARQVIRRRDDEDIPDAGHHED